MLHHTKLEWNFFATSHGKWAVDGVGATVKRVVSTAALTRKLVLTDAKKFAEIANDNCPKVSVLYMSSETVDEHCQTMGLEDIWRNILPVKGTHDIHFITSHGDAGVLCKIYTTAENSTCHLLWSETISELRKSQTETVTLQGTLLSLAIQLKGVSENFLTRFPM